MPSGRAPTVRAHPGPGSQADLRPRPPVDRAFPEVGFTRGGVLPAAVVPEDAAPPAVFPEDALAAAVLPEGVLAADSREDVLAADLSAGVFAVFRAAGRRRARRDGPRSRRSRMSCTASSALSPAGSCRSRGREALVSPSVT